MARPCAVPFTLPDRSRWQELRAHDGRCNAGGEDEVALTIKSVVGFV